MINIIKISIIIPVYNAEQYIERCLLSVMHQTYTDNLECILVDDCGKDNSISIAEKMLAKYKGNITFRIIHHKHNRGVSASRNFGLKVAHGDYIYYLDSDDEITQSCIELLAKQVILHPNIQCVQGYTRSIPPEIDHFDTRRFSKYQYVADNVWIRSNIYKIKYGIPCEAWNKLFNKRFLLNNNLFFHEDISIAEDLHWIYKIAPKLQSIAFVFTTTYIHYYNNKGSLMTSLTIEKDATNFKLVVFDCLKNTDEISQKFQLQIILMCFLRHQVYRVCSIHEISVLFSKAKEILIQERQYQSLRYLLLWKCIYPLRNVRKFLRLSYEKIK